MIRVFDLACATLLWAAVAAAIFTPAFYLRFDEWPWAAVTFPLS
jgi:hypothetical protein